MKIQYLAPVFLIAVAGTTVISCGKEKSPVSTTNAVNTTKDGVAYQIDQENSKIEWKGFKVFKSESTSHFGTINFKSGEFTVKNDVIESGKVLADMNSLDNVDLKDQPELKNKLENHLKSADFFEVSQYPEAVFEITKVTVGTGDYNSVIDGNLTIKQVTKPVQFNANVSVTDQFITIATEPKDINREDFGIKFQAPIENGLIKNEVNIQISIKALKK